jgi:hypothetical protein
MIENDKQLAVSYVTLDRLRKAVKDAPQVQSGLSSDIYEAMVAQLVSIIEDIELEISLYLNGTERK